MAPRAPSISRQYGLLSRLIVSVLTLLARLPRMVVESRFYFPDQIKKNKEMYYGPISLVVGRL